MKPLFCSLLLTTFLFTNTQSAEDEKQDPKEVLKELIAIWKDYQMPFPPDDAPLVEIPVSYRSGNSDRASRSIGFKVRTEPREHQEKTIILVGSQEYLAPDRPKLDAIEPLTTEKAIERIASKEIRGTVDISGPNHLVITALQCANRNEMEIATALLELATKTDGGEMGSNLATYPGMAPKQLLTYYLWNHAYADAMHPTKDRTASAKLMRKLIDNGDVLHGEMSTYLCESLEAALVPSKAEPGSIQSLVDGLVNTTKDGGHFSSSKTNPSDPYQILREHGFEAIPVLIESLDDKRLTRSVTQGFNNFSTWPRQVGDVVSDLIQDITNLEMNTTWLSRQKGSRSKKEVVQEWWDKNRDLGERHYLLKQVYPKKPDGFPSGTQIAIIAKKYPADLSTIYRTLLKEYPDSQSHTLVSAISESTIPGQEKLALFTEAIAHPNWDHRYPAIRAIYPLDKPLYHKTVQAWLNDWPTDSENPYWKCWEARISHCVLITDDKSTWALFEKTVQKAALGLRLELMNPFSYTNHQKDHTQELRVRLLAKYLDDETARIAKGKKYEGPYAGFKNPHLRVCDYVSPKIVSILKLDGSKWPSDFWKRSDRSNLKTVIEETF